MVQFENKNASIIDVWGKQRWNVISYSQQKKKKYLITSSDFRFKIISWGVC